MTIGVSDWGAIGERAAQDYDLHMRMKIWAKKIRPTKIFIA